MSKVKINENKIDSISNSVSDIVKMNTCYSKFEWTCVCCSENKSNINIPLKIV